MATAVFVACAAPVHAAPTPHQSAVADARAGRFDKALAVLEPLVRQYPGRLAYRYDLVVVLSWAERHADALAASRSLRLNATPDYVLSAIGKSALNGGDVPRAMQAYRLLLARRPSNADAARGLALARQAADRAAVQAVAPVAQAAVQAASPATPPVPASAYPAAAPAPLAIPAQAAVSAPEQRHILATLQEHNAAHIRYAMERLDNDFTSTRYGHMDAVLAENDVLADEARIAGQTDVLRRLRYDRVLALRARGDMVQAVILFRALEAEGDALPPYVLNAAADATLALREPEQARALYQRALAADATSANLRTGLAYAQLEAENFPGVEQAVSELLAGSSNAVGARRTQATMLRFSDRLDEAEALVNALGRELPDDAGIWLDQGDLLARRGLPRAAAARYRQVLGVEPANIKARVGLANAGWAQGDIAATAQAVAELQRDAPEHPAVQRLLRDWQRNQRPVLDSTVTKGFGEGQVLGNDDLVWESTLYSGQSGQGLRWYANHYLAKATFNGTQPSHERVGAGIEWTRRDLQLSAELGQDLRNAHDTSWSVAAGWQIDDAWSLRARHESETNDFPLKGRQPGAEAGAPTYLHASKTLVGGAYRWNESRRVAADASFYDFNDGNRRQALALSWFERLLSANGHTLDLLPAFYTSRNSLADAVYFNPKRDVALSATLTADWLTWRRYERSFNQRLSATLGSYRQISDVAQGGGLVERNYGFMAFQDVRYEHEWHFGPDVSTRYGLGLRRFPYDGVYETKHYIYANLNWRF